MHGSVCSTVPKSITSINRRTLHSRHSAQTRQINVGSFAQNSSLVHNAAFRQGSGFKQSSAVKGRCLVKAAAATKELDLPDPQSGGIDFKLIVSLTFSPHGDEEE